ncbi:MAG: hypothetical protein IJ088_13505 [Clostridia bacterium]|nr:hypothetical protein [Clostridia bacterium]
MGKFTDLLFSILLGWVRTLTGFVWSAFTSDRESILEWLGRYWLPVCLILVAAGLAGDWLVWLIRWRPFHAWSVRARETLRIRDDSIVQMNVEQVGPEAAEQLMEEAEEEAPESGPTREEKEEEVLRRAASFPDEKLGEYPGMRFEQGTPAGDTQTFQRPAGVEDEQTRYQRELQEYEVKRAQYERDLAEWNRMQEAEKQARYEKEMEEYRDRRARYALEMAAYERDLAEYERLHGKQESGRETDSGEAPTGAETDSAKKRRRGSQGT